MDAALGATDPVQDRPLAAWLRCWLAPLLAPTAVAAGLTLFDLTWRSVWIDEASTFAVASQHGATLWHLLVAAGGNFFLYYPLMHLLTSIFGSSLLVLRLPSAIAAIATVPVAAVLMTRLFDRRAAIFGTWLLVLSGPLIYWGQQARGYSIAVLLVTIAALGLVTAMDGRKAGWWVFAGCSLLAIYTVLLAGLVVVAMAVSVWVRGRESVPWRRWAVTVAAIAVGCIPMFFLAFDRGIVVLDWLGKPGTSYGPSNSYLVKFLVSAKTSAMPVTFASVVILVLMLAVIGFGVVQFGWRQWRHGRDATTWPYGLLLSWLLLPPVVAYLFSVVVDPVLVDRYILTSVPPASMLAGVIVSRITPRALSVGLAAVLIAALGYQLEPSYHVSLENWRGTSHHLAVLAKPGDCVAFFAADGYDAIDFYVETRSLAGFPRPVLPATPYQNRTSYALDPAVFTPAALQSAATSCSRLWLVRSHVATTRPVASAPSYVRQSYARYRTLSAQLASRFRLVRTKSLKTITVMLYRPLA